MLVVEMIVRPPYEFWLKREAQPPPPGGSQGAGALGGWLAAIDSATSAAMDTPAVVGRTNIGQAQK